MTNNTPTITIHMVCSTDGFIAKADNSIGWFETTSYYEKGADEPDVAAFLKTIDCYVMGARTYELALELSKQYGWPYGDTPTIVLSHRNLPVNRTNVRIFSGSLQELAAELLQCNYASVWVAGGAELAKDFINAQLASEIRIGILPILLGDGKRFFNDIAREQALQLKDVTAYKNGMVELWYAINQAQPPEKAK